MSAKWQYCTFGDVVDLEQGLAFNKKTNHLMCESGIPLLRITNLINDTEDKFVNAELVPRKFIAHPNDLIYTRTGQVGLVFRGRVGVVHNNCFRIIPQEHVSREYTYWFLKQPEFRQKAISVATGSAQPDLNHGAFKSLPFHYPPLPTQHKIASILSAYDDLIENNTRRIAILEEMAQTIYRQWFVNFRFPGHEKVKLVDSPLGLIPEGWEPTHIEDICERITSGGTPRTKTEKFWDGDIPWLSSGETGNRFITETVKKITKEGVENSSTRFVRSGSTVIASAGQGKTRGQTSMLLLDSYINQSVIALTADTNKVTDNYLFLDLARRYRQFRQISDGSSRGSLTTKLLAELSIVLPPVKLVTQFDVLANPIVRNIELCIRKNANLRATRDLLLPKLISGKLDVEDLDIDVGLATELPKEAIV